MVTALITLAALAAAAAAAPVGPGGETRVIQILDGTLTSQPIELPAGPVRVTISEMTIPAGARLPRHRHPYARYVNVLDGRLAVKDLATGAVVELRPQDWAVDIVGAWHEGQALGDTPVRLLLIEQAPAGAATTIPGDELTAQPAGPR